eukprot:comp24174_c0_seq1/m.44196 comp24174_c0_seq1/g.44196  ORF comp24174_c0_seq1/g.44196 comp24174_c0_seq1/m.44196 type:complete len:352 (-) comp24174_c0_seq1:616-1671(-)
MAPNDKKIADAVVAELERAPNSVVAVCFDFDGTLSDTETPAMEVAYWEIAPYLPPPLPSADEFIRLNAGKAFEFMLESCDQQRASMGLPSIQHVRELQLEDPDVIRVVDAGRKKFGLRSFAETRKIDLLTLQKDDTVEALAKTARAIEGVVPTLMQMKQDGVLFNIATTSGAPRVLASRDASGLLPFFPDSHVHSGESDYVPPRFKPDPSVYLKACMAHGLRPIQCVAVEDSGSGVGSAANAKIGLIIGFVGGSHIKEEMMDSHARMLMSGAKSEDGRGADIVISKFDDVGVLVRAFAECIVDGVKNCVDSGEGSEVDIAVVRVKTAKTVADKLAAPCWVNGDTLGSRPSA